MRARLFFATLFVAILACHLCHAHILWAEEDLPVAAARQILFGKTLYRDIWFDKPPLVPLLYLLWGAKIGFILRIFGSLYILACCWVAWLFARDLWGEHEGYWAAALLGFALAFDTPSAVIPLAADLLMLLPHLAAVYLAAKGRPFSAGLCAGLAFLTNVKAAFVLVACALFALPAIPLLAAGFAAPILLAALVLIATGSWPAYLDQVWAWPAIYAGSSHVPNPIANGILRTLNWAGFHCSLVLAAAFTIVHNLHNAQPAQPAQHNTPSAPVAMNSPKTVHNLHNRWLWLAWLALSFAGVALGARFFPRYFFQLLPPVVLLAACGFVRLPARWRWAILSLLLIPLIRFGPRYPILALNLQPSWSDLSMNADSQAASNLILQAAHSGDTLYVWGYRPDIFAYTNLRAASKFLDSQAMTGVPADRHLGQSQPVALGTTAQSRHELAQSHPDFIADGLSLYNPRLAMNLYPELRPWLAGYREFARTRYTVLYRRNPAETSLR